MWEATPFAGGGQLGSLGDNYVTNSSSTNPWGKFGQWGYDAQTGERMPAGGGPNPSWGAPTVGAGNGYADVRLGGQVSAPSGTAVNNYADAQPSVASNQNTSGASNDTVPPAPGDNGPASGTPGAPANGAPRSNIMGGAFHPLRNWFGSQRAQLLRRGPGAGGFGTLYSTQRRSSLGDGYWSRLNSMGGG